MAKSFVAKHWKKLLVIIILLAGVGVFFINKNKSSEIKTAQIQKGDIKEELVLSGEVNAVNYANLSFETVGKIVYVGVGEGDVVTKGKLISKLDTTVLNSSYQTALATLRAYEATVANVHDQVKDHSADETYAQKDSRTTAEANKDKAYEAVIAAKRNLDGASLYAPFGGIITYLAHPFTGVYSGVGSVEATIIDPSTIYFEVLADQTEVTMLKIGQSVEIAMDSFEEKPFTGVVETISFVPKSGETGTSYSIKVKINGLDPKDTGLRVGMSGDAKFVVAEKSGVLFVPSDFVNADKEGSYIRLGKKNNKIYVKTGLESEENVEIIGDFSEGQTVYD